MTKAPCENVLQTIEPGKVHQGSYIDDNDSVDDVDVSEMEQYKKHITNSHRKHNANLIKIRYEEFPK